MTNAEATRRAQQLARGLQQIGSARGRTTLQKRLGETAITQAALGVRQGRDPYGKAWKPLTSRTGRPLRKTGNNIQRSWTAGGETPDNFVFGSRFAYLATHQYGAIIKPVHAKMLRFRVEVARRVSWRNGRARIGGAVNQVVYALQVEIPRRQLVPEQNTGGIGPIWLKAFERTVSRWLAGNLTPRGR